MTYEELMQEIRDFGDAERGWFHSSNELAFRDLADKLIGYGLSVDAVFDILGRAYAAVADEFGC